MSVKLMCFHVQRANTGGVMEHSYRRVLPTMRRATACFFPLLLITSIVKGDVKEERDNVYDYEEDLVSNVQTPVLPGHTLLRPALDHLKSAIKYPRTSPEDQVYGGSGALDNSGKLWKILYTDFRRMSDDQAQDLFQDRVNDFNEIYTNHWIQHHHRSEPVLASETGVSGVQKNEDSKAASKVFHRTATVPLGHRFYLIVAPQNPSIPMEDEITRRNNNRRRSKKKNKKKRKEKKKKNQKKKNDDYSDDDDDRILRENNPFTLLEADSDDEGDDDWYYQKNFIWNIEMTGDHMNIYEDAPKFDFRPPAVPSMYGNMKNWWYYNQDDFRPFSSRRNFPK